MLEVDSEKPGHEMVILSFQVGWVWMEQRKQRWNMGRYRRARRADVLPRLLRGLEVEAGMVFVEYHGTWLVSFAPKVCELNLLRRECNQSRGTRFSKNGMMISLMTMMLCSSIRVLDVVELLSSGVSVVS
jgi:hypothetical protein